MTDLIFKILLINQIIFYIRIILESKDLFSNLEENILNKLKMKMKVNVILMDILYQLIIL